jgi:hypothetical protein
MEKLLTISGLATTVTLAVGPALAAPISSVFGGRAPAPEIGAGVLGVLLSVAAVRCFRQRSRS